MNIFKTFVLMALLTSLMVAVGGWIGDSTGAMIMLAIATGINFFSYWFSDSIVLKSYNAREVTEADAPQLYDIVSKLAKNADLPMPRVYVIDSDAPNAFATGRNPDNAAVAVTTGLMKALDYNEISGVLGHELAHVKHRDILIGTIAAAMAGVISMVADIVQWGAIFGTRSDDDDNGNIISLLATIIIAPLAATLIQLAVSRSREYDADKTGGEICGNPLYLANALEKIEYYVQRYKPMPQAGTATAHMFIINPLENSKKALKNLFSTHPDTDDRINHLREQAREMHLLA
ncbi:MAG: zinc metalloprotease HtpX [Selenomonadaceae bacterium]|nr:zinc metalloprotease HtpX [Selenomonadaceae bacterium]MBQ9497697.1 zinc metalloprotease HtpX [Selenomonadaceae bacterium]